MDELTQRMFKVLEISESASIIEIEARYRELVRKYQAAQSSDDPASRQEAWQRLKEVSSAYEIVKKYWSERNIPQGGPVSYRRQNSTAPGPAALGSAITSSARSPAAASRSRGSRQRPWAACAPTDRSTPARP